MLELLKQFLVFLAAHDWFYVAAAIAALAIMWPALRADHKPLSLTLRVAPYLATLGWAIGIVLTVESMLAQMLVSAYVVIGVGLAIYACLHIDLPPRREHGKRRA